MAVVRDDPLEVFSGRVGPCAFAPLYEMVVEVSDDHDPSSARLRAAST